MRFIALVYLVTGATNNRGEHSPGSIISSEASLHQAGAIVAHKGGGLIVVTHVCGFWRRKVKCDEFMYSRFTQQHLTH